jgi:hypothetical protein
MDSVGLRLREPITGDGSNMRKFVPLPVVAALSVLLSACFTSENPKFPMSSAVAAFGKGGRYVVFEHVRDGKFRKQRVLTVKPMPDGSYQFVGEKSVLPISFHDIGNGIVVGQAKPKDNKNAYAYLFLRKQDAEAFFHLPQCDKQDPAVLSKYGVVHRDKYECSIDKVSDPAKLFAALDAGEPTSKLAPE